MKINIYAIRTFAIAISVVAISSESAYAFKGQFPDGQCTYGVDQLKNWKIDWCGSALDWYSNARQVGYTVSSSASIGAIIVWPSNTASSLGHVGVITSLTPLKYKAMNDYGAPPNGYTERLVSEYPNKSKPVAPIGYVNFDKGNAGPITGSGGCNYQSTFVKDITIPDNTVIPAGTLFTKTWSLKNTGSVDALWNSRRVSLVALSSDAVCKPTSIAAIPTATFGQAVNVSINLTAAKIKGTYTCFYTLSTPNGGQFPTKFYVKYIVK